MKKLQNDEALLSEIASELGIDITFVEKDLFATEILSIVSSTDFDIVFGGGTSLSKAYGLIQRFSEDLDFRVCLPDHDMPKGQVRKKMKEIRESILDLLRAREDLFVIEDSVEAKNENRFFRFEIEYKQSKELKAWRLFPRIRLEFSLSLDLQVFEKVC